MITFDWNTWEFMVIILTIMISYFLWGYFYAKSKLRKSQRRVKDERFNPI